MKTYTQFLTEAPEFSQSQFDAKLNSFFSGCEKIFNDYMAKHYPNNPKEVLKMTIGPKYAKITKVFANSRSGSVHVFVDRTNGDVLKPASYKAPAKGARGNIFDDKNGLGRMTAYGPEYNR